MKTNRILSAILAIAAVSATGAYAASLPETPSVSVTAKSVSLLGSAAPASAAERTITINADTRYVNVTGGSTVRFIVGGQSFTWNFQTGGSHTAPFDLARLAPAGALNHKVVVYVSDDPLYLG